MQKKLIQLLLESCFQLQFLLSTLIFGLYQYFYSVQQASLLLNKKWIKYNAENFKNLLILDLPSDKQFLKRIFSLEVSCLLRIMESSNNSGQALAVVLVYICKCKKNGYRRFKAKSYEEER